MNDKQIKDSYVVYKVVIEGIARYIGYSGNINNRSISHNKELARWSKSGKTPTKQLYKWLLDRGITEIELIPIRSFNTKTEAVRFEAYCILAAYFSSSYTLIQRIPSLSDNGGEWVNN